jgi:hypothetical protein
MTMYQIWSSPEDYTIAKSELLAIMTMPVMRAVFDLLPEGVARVEREAGHGCWLFFRQPIPGFGKRVMVGAFDEGRLA